MLANVLTIVAVALVPLAGFGLLALLVDRSCRDVRRGPVARLVRAGTRRVARRARRLRLVAEPAPTPVGRPLEAIAADLRRINGLLDVPRAQSFVVRAGTLRAYDTVLAEACRALGVEHRLDGSAERDCSVERLQAEAALEGQGMVLRGPPHAHRRAA